MTQKNNLQTQPIHRASLYKRMLQGAVIAFIAISAFLISAGAGDPAWGKFWMIRPLVIVPLAGAGGGVFYFFMDHLRYQGGWKLVVAHILSLLGYIVALWMGTVLGLDGTLWN